MDTKIVLTICVALVPSIQCSQKAAVSFDQLLQAFFTYSTAELPNEKTSALKKFQDLYKQAPEYAKQQLLAEIKMSGFNSQDLGLISQASQPVVKTMPEETVLGKYVPAPLLTHFTPADKKRYEALIEQARKEGDEGWIKYQVNQELQADAKIKQMHKGAEVAPKSAVLPPRTEQEAKEAAAGDIIILKARTQGEGKYLWDCTWEVLNNSAYLYKLLKEGKAIPQDISHAPYNPAWCPKSDAFEKLQMQSDAIEDVIKQNKLLGDDYAFIEGDVKQLAPEFILNMDRIKKIKTTPGTAFAFIVNPAGHWFTVVAHNKQGKINFYVADDTPKDRGTYEAVVKFIKSLL